MWICRGATVRLLAATGCLSVLASVAMAAQRKPVAAAAHAPASQRDCAAAAKALDRQAETLSKRTRQIIPREFARVSANLDDYCDEGDFEKRGSASTG